MTKSTTMRGRDAFIQNIASRLGRKEPLREAPAHPLRGVPEHYKAMSYNPDELVELFVRNWTALTGKVLLVKRSEAREAIGAYIKEISAELGVTQISRWEHERLLELGLDDTLQAAGIKVVPWREDEDEAPAGAEQAGQEDLAEPLSGSAGETGSGPNWAKRSKLLRETERCQLGLVWPDYAVAGTSTLVLPAYGGRGRSVSLLTSILVAVFDKEQLVFRMGEALEALRRRYPHVTDVPSSINLITGPSRSADIENDLTIGIHGPGKVYAVILHDE
ncbi:LutC/YkgG family protein [Paenibacillus sp. y28]|uniref:LutC/YkgG family protein n=1 Tax=Paenibacillus sp. y28 TaxID=3129110 RepID=UPI00301B27F9